MLVLIGLGLSVYFSFNFTIQGQTLIDYRYYWLFMAIFCPLVFLLVPARKKDTTVPWYDVVAIILTAGTCLYLSTHAWDISVEGWYNIPTGIIILLVLMEGARRGGGNVFLIVILVLGAYPLFADYMPGILWGRSFTPELTLRSLVFRSEGLLGLPLKVMAEILVGFLVFAGTLLASGGGEFFLRLSSALVGKFRGGPAKVAVLSSGFFGSMSGSAVSNVAATGSFTIPIMKRTGYPPHYAGAIEACASTGGMFMPPIMGAVAFIMCEFIGIEYRLVIVAAALPAILYYFGLLMQVDAYAARAGLVGLSEKEVPSLLQTLKDQQK